MESTTSAIVNNHFLPTIKDFLLPLLQYFISPAVTIGLGWLLLKKAYNLGEINEKFKSALGDIKDLKKDSKTLLRHIDIIRAHLVSKLGMDANLFTSHSPVALTEKGEKLLEISGFKKIYNDHKDLFIDKFKKRHIKNMADIDETSMSTLEQMKDDDMFKNFKEIAFEQGIALELLLKVCSIYLRDQVAKELKIR